MNKNMFIGIALAIVILIGYVAFTNFESPKAAEALVYAETSNYKFQEYDEATFNNDSNHKVLFFGSAGCGSCAKKHKLLAKSPDQFSNVNVYRIEFEKSPASLREKYGVTKWDTLVIIKSDGSHETKASLDLEELPSTINN